MNGFLLILIGLIITGVTFWLNTNLNEREKALLEREKKLNQQESFFKTARAQYDATLGERLKQAQSQDQALNERKAELESFATWLKEQDLEMDKKYSGIKAKAEKDVAEARQERNAARRRASRLQEEIKTLKGKSTSKSKANLSGDVITP